MKIFSRQRSFAVDMIIAFGLVLGMCAVAGWMALDMTNRLLNDTRDAVWEAAVPPNYAYDLLGAQWRNHFDAIGALTDPSDLAKTRAAIAARAKAEQEWKKLAEMSVGFPQDVRAAIATTEARLAAFRAALAASLDGAATGSAEARATLAAQQAGAITAFADTADAMLKVMNARIQHVTQRMEATAMEALVKIISTGTIIALALIGAGIVLQRRIVTPISRLSDVMTALMNGDHDVAVPQTHRQDEVGRLTGTVQAFRSSLAETERLRAEQERLRAEAEMRRKASMATLAEEFEGKVGRVVETVTSSVDALQRAAEAMSREAGDATGQATAVAAASEEATENVRMVASATGDLATAMNAVGAQVASASERMRAAAEAAQRTNANVEALGSAAESISSVAKVISDIAGQTNLLALNATIEAARAGEAGRGFAVVAQEVKALAAQTGRATEEIAGQISAIQAASTGAIEAIRAIARTIGEVAALSETIGDAIGRQMETTGMIAGNVDEAARGTIEVSKNISHVSVAIGNSASLVSEVLLSARHLGQEGEALRGAISGFLDSIRAA
ncbi:methyl-accepting chemotaxis protein [Rhabdaerophilum calidifontis]|uniref:methyl-accepting chemotaxis protein n=1 Tax=Rhabdaerophilum calidifontis TaxID=2604328 RepID=UPI00123C6230|nr:methyl-accepting chemotaxis protein [Rhabdaerophilum calidifontis]